MHISLITAPPEQHHGWGNYTLALARELLRTGHTLSIVTGVDAPPEIDLPAEVSIQRVLPGLMKPKRFNSARLFAAAQQVRRLTAEADIVHVTAEPYALAARLVTKPLVVTAHGTYLPLLLVRPFWSGLYRRVFERSPIICVSRYTESQVRVLLPEARTAVIPNGVTLEAIRRTVPPVAKNGPTVVALGQLKPRKGYHLLAQAMKQVRTAVPNAQAVFLGDDSDGGYVNEIRAELAADGLTDAVRIAGRVSDDVKIGWLQAAEVFAMPALNIDGKFEGFGLVYLEASAAGLPVIGTLGCGAEDAILDGETGYLIPQNDVPTLADKIIELLRDGALRQRMGAAGWNYAEEHTWARQTQEVIKLYNATRDFK
jgi:glycosyltransferase involved in cell wall biosynthesis